MTKRTWIVTGAVGLPLVFAIGVWVGASGQDEGVAPSTTRLTAVETTTIVPSSDSTARTIRTPSTVPATSTTTKSMPPTTAAPRVEAPLPPGWESAVVVRVVDGDTIDVRLDNGDVEPLRLIGTNSPEGGECYASEATAGLTELILDEKVYLEPDDSDRDQFGRLLRYVWTNDDLLVNEVTVEEGWAIAREYPPDTARADELGAAQDRAMSVEAGLWAKDACGDSRPPDVQIAHVEYDAPGDDNSNLNGEWAEITNADVVEVDLTGWVLKDETASHRYRFPSGFTLQPQASVRVFSGCGQNSSTEIYWCNTGSAIWNNSGDTAFLLDPTGNLVFSYAYG